MQSSTGFQKKGHPQRCRIPLPGQPVTQLPSGAAARRDVLQEHRGSHVAPCGCLYDPRIHNIGSNGTQGELLPRLDSPFYSQNFILNRATIPAHPDLQYLSPLYHSPSDHSVYQPPPIYYQQTSILLPGRNQVAYSSQLFPINGKTQMSTVPAKFQGELPYHHIQLQLHHKPRQNQNNQPPKDLKSKEAKSKEPQLQIDTPVQESSSDPMTATIRLTSNNEAKQKHIVSSACNKSQLKDNEEQMLAALDAVSEDELNERTSNERIATSKDTRNLITQVSEALPEKVTLEDAMKMFDCIPFRNASLNNSPATTSGKLSNSADLNEFRTDVENSVENTTNENVSNAVEISWDEMTSLSLKPENSIGLLALPKELVSSNYEVPELTDIISTMDFFYSVSTYSLFSDELSDCNPHLAFCCSAKDCSCNPGVSASSKPGELSPITDTSIKIPDSVKREKRHSTDMTTQPVSKKCRITDSAVLEAVQEFCVVSMSATMKKRLGIEDS
ncbi:proline-rich protein 22-like [Narcine bancroftii]|uniref:proline-rich protein 22-like n=1 Tax=Narcine bancroftii TaxID=1343680 RepID=UPI003832038F